jgi:hypothetical protein
MLSATRPVSVPASSLPLAHPKIPLSPFFRRALTKLLSQIASLRDSYLIDRSHRVEQQIPAPYRRYVASNKATDGSARPLTCSCSTSELEAEANTVPVKLLPVILNSKEEIGWKVQPQNSNLRQEIV